MKQKKIFPPTYLLTALALMLGLHFLFPLVKVIVSPYDLLGILLILSGVALNIWAANFFDKVETSIKPFEESSYLATEGLYKYSRNPMYFGMLMILIGTFIVLGSITPMLVIPVFMWIITKVFILAEEKALEERFGETYLKYKCKVRRWI